MELTQRRMLVTGDAKFIDSHPAERLVAKKNQVAIVDNLPEVHGRWIPSGVEYIQAELTKKDEVDQVVEPDFDFVLHLAAGKETDDREARSSVSKPRP